MIVFNYVGQHYNLEQEVTLKDWADEWKFVAEFVDGGEEFTTYNDAIDNYNQKNEEGSDLYVFIRMMKLTPSNTDSDLWIKYCETHYE